MLLSKSSGENLLFLSLKVYRKRISVDNSLNIEHVVLPVPERPIARTFPGLPIKFSCSSVNLILKSGILFKKFINSAQLVALPSLLIMLK